MRIALIVTVVALGLAMYGSWQLRSALKNGRMEFGEVGSLLHSRLLRSEQPILFWLRIVLGTALLLFLILVGLFGLAILYPKS